VYVDSCNVCYGVWLDDGELNKIAGQKKAIDEEFSETRMQKLLSFLKSIVRK
jgi:Zn-finger nucleic acid-binding protein